MGRQMGSRLEGGRRAGPLCWAPRGRARAPGPRQLGRWIPGVIGHCFGGAREPDAIRAAHQHRRRLAIWARARLAPGRAPMSNRARL